MMVFAASLSSAQNRAFLRRQVPRLGRKRALRRAPRIRFPEQAEREYLRGLLTLVARMVTAQSQLLERELPAILGEAQSAKPVGDSVGLMDAWSDRLRRLIESVRTAFGGVMNEGEISGLASRVARSVSRFSAEQESKVLKSVLGVDVLTSEPWLEDELRAFVGQNGPVIFTMAERHVTRLSKIIYDGAANGLRYEAIAAQIQELTGVSERHAAFIARDQVGSFNGLLTRLRQQQVGVSRYRWRGVMDRRERPHHVAREGQIFRWDDPPPGGHPGMDWLCRCIAEPILDDLLAEETA